VRTKKDVPTSKNNDLQIIENREKALALFNASTLKQPSLN